MRRLRGFVVLWLAFVPAALGIAACSSAPEQPILNQFFRAARLRDATALRGFATVNFDPATQGTISSFDIESVSPEVRTPLAVAGLAREHEAIRAEETEFTKRKDSYQVANFEAVQRVVRAEARGEPAAKNDAAVQAAWSKLREESAQFSQRLTDASRKLAAESAVARVSLRETGADPAKQDGEMVSKDVTIAATVRPPDGAAVDQLLVVTLQRAVVGGSPPVEGKWVVTAVHDSAGRM